jgi:hypothetical protein
LARFTGRLGSNIEGQDLAASRESLGSATLQGSLAARLAIVSRVATRPESGGGRRRGTGSRLLDGVVGIDRNNSRGLILEIKTSIAGKPGAEAEIKARS